MKKDIIAESTVTDEMFGCIRFIYSFDKNDYLQRIEVIEGSEPQIIFDRKREIELSLANVSSSILLKENNVAV